MKLTHNIKHIGIILDGNRRWAKKTGLPSWKGHEKGADVVEKLLDWAKELEIKELSLYVLSTENLKRTQKELGKLFWLFGLWRNKVIDDKRIFENKIRIKYIGDLSLLPKKVQKQCRELENLTKKHNGLILNFCMAYGGRKEIIEAMKKLIKKKQRVTEKNLINNLWLSSEPDLIIRTGNRQRLSNFLAFQSVYSELFFSKKMWPDFTKADLVKVIKEFNKRQRNFGK